MTSESALHSTLTVANNPAMQALIEQVSQSHNIIEAWLDAQWAKTPPPLYGSVDLRNAGCKVSPVDMNLFPAGFNNLDPNYMPHCVEAVRAAIHELCADAKELLIIAESHTRNKFYFENLATLQQIISQAGYVTRIATMNDEIIEVTHFELPSGRKIIIEPLQYRDGKIGVEGFFPAWIILNNDFSDGVPTALTETSQLIMPSTQMSWSSRLKSNHFKFYQQIAEELAQQLQFDPWLLNPYFEQCSEVDFLQQGGQDCLVEETAKLLQRVQKKYDEYDIKQQPFAVIKADQGTYGMAVMMVKDPAELTTLNRKQRSRMAMSKGGKPVSKAIIQEGVFSFETIGESHSVAEPVLYMFGRQVIGGFYRVHADRGPDENLNAPGMNFTPMSIKYCCSHPPKDQKYSYYYLYGVVARLAMLAAAREISALSEQVAQG